MATKRALLVRLSSLGDVIFNIPLAAVLKANGYEVTWITSEKGYDVIKNNPYVDEAILAPLKKWKKQKFSENFKEYKEILKHIRSKKFDIAIDTQLLIKSFIWMIFSGAKRRIVSTSAREFAFLGGTEIIGKIQSDNIHHAIENYLKFAKHLKLDTSNIEVGLPESTPEIISKIDELLKDLNRNKPVIAIAPATTWKPKHWNKNNWKKLIGELEKNYTLIFTGTPADNELIEDISGGKHLNIAGKTTVLELAEVFKRCDLAISLDSGSTHLAWATKKPKIVTIFCCTPTHLYAPIGPKDKYIALTGKLQCQPCHKRVCPLKRGRNRCTLLPDYKDVLNAVHTLLPVTQNV